MSQLPLVGKLSIQEKAVKTIHIFTLYSKNNTSKWEKVGLEAKGGLTEIQAGCNLQRRYDRICHEKYKTSDLVGIIRKHRDNATRRDRLFLERGYA